MRRRHLVKVGFIWRRHLEENANFEALSDKMSGLIWKRHLEESRLIWKRHLLDLPANSHMAEMVNLKVLSAKD